MPVRAQILRIHDRLAFNETGLFAHGRIAQQGVDAHRLILAFHLDQIKLDGGETPGAFSTDPVNDGQWHHVALTRDAATGEVQVYVDGELDGTAAGEAGARGTGRPIRNPPSNIGSPKKAAEQIAVEISQALE